MPVILGAIDDPLPGAEFDTGTLHVSGWAYCEVAKVARVQIYLDDRLLGRAGLARVRPELARSLDRPDAGLSGFELSVPVPRQAHRRVATIRAVVTTLDGTRRVFAAHDVRLGQAVGVRRIAESPRPTHGWPLDRHGGAGTGRFRVLWWARSLDLGGSQLRMAETVAHVSRSGAFENTVVAPSEGPLRAALEETGAEVRVVAPVALDELAAYERAQAALLAWMEGRFDLVVGFTVTSFPAVDAANRLGVPSALRIGESEPLRTVVGWVGGQLDDRVEDRARRAFAGASVLLSISHTAVETYRADGFDGRYVVIPTGVDVAGSRAYVASTDRDELRRRVGVGPCDQLLVCAGTMWPVKGQAVLVAAMDHLHRSLPHLRCALIGVDVEPYAQEIRSYVERRRLSRTVRVLPFEADLRPWWRAADVAVCASESEALPAAVLEAMAFGVPVLASRVGDVPRVIRHGASGWLVDHSDVAAMVSAVGATARVPSSRLRSMGEAAAAQVAASYDRPASLERVTDLLYALARRRGPEDPSDDLGTSDLGQAR